MRPEPDFYTHDASQNLPELRLWRAVLSRAMLDVQHGSQAQARDVLKWIDTKDFERVVVWAGFELEQGRFASRWLRETFAQRFERGGDASEAVGEEQFDQDASDAKLPADEGTPHTNALLTLIFTARDITRAKKNQHARRARRHLRQRTMIGEPLQLG